MTKEMKVLIIEDLPSDVDLAKREVRKVLPDSNFKVVDEKESYIREIKSYKPDLIISDYQMPKFDGFSALLIKNDVLPSVPFIMLTGSVNEEVAVKCMKNGADDYVIKEHIKRLGSAILNAIDKKQSENERKKIEEQLKLISTAVEQSPVSIVITNKNGDIVYVNPAFEEVTGYKFDEVQGKNPNVLKSGETKSDNYKKLWDTITSGKKWSGEFLNKKKDGTLFWETASISPVINSFGDITHYLGVKEDITDERKMVQELMNREEKFRTLTHNLNVGVYRNSAGRNGKFIEGNPAFLKILGLRDKSEFDLYKMVDFYLDQESRTEIEDKLKRQDYLLNEEIQLKRKDGEIFYASISTTTVRDTDGKIICYDGIIEDITERKEIQNNILNQKLEVEALNNQLINTEEESKRQLAIALHDTIGQSLAAAKFKIDQLKAKSSQGENEKLINEVLDNIQKAINESRNITYELSPPILYDNGLIATIQWKLEEIAKNSIKTKLIDKTEGYQLDSRIQISLYRTITEIFQNVIKHSDAQTLEVTFLKEENNYIVNISDDGIGFDYKEISERAVKDKKFGLYSVIERIKYLGGEMDIDTKNKKGTNIKIKLPLS